MSRAQACLLGQAVGDALGVPYEYGSRPLEPQPKMVGGGLGPYAPGEWSDDTQMAACITLAAHRHPDLGDAFIEDVAVRFRSWANGGATDIGGNTAGVLRHDLVRTAARGEVAAACHTVAQHNWEDSGAGLGNGSLMRTAALAAAMPDVHCDQVAGIARTVAALTHAAPLAQEATACWTVMLFAAIMGEPVDTLTGYGLQYTAPWARTEIQDALALAQRLYPYEIANNGHVSRALQAAWSAVWWNREISRATDRFACIVSDAVNSGGDTDTVAAIAGGMAGAIGGMAAIPKRWKTRVFGWPGLTGLELASLAA